MSVFELRRLAEEHYESSDVEFVLFRKAENYYVVTFLIDEYNYLIVRVEDEINGLKNELSFNLWEYEEADKFAKQLAMMFIRR